MNKVIDTVPGIGSAMMQDIFVICLTKREYDFLLSNVHRELDHYIENKLIHRVEHFSELATSKSARVILCGRYYARPDWPHMEEIIASHGHRTLLVR